MKKLFFSLIALFGIALVANAGLVVVPMGTNTVAGGSVSNAIFSGTVLSLAQTTDATFQLSSKSSAANTSNNIVWFDVSADASTWVSNAVIFTWAANGTAKSTMITNLPAGMRYPFWRPAQWTNENGGSVTLTNLDIRVFTKDGI